MKMSDRMGVEGLETHSLMAINLLKCVGQCKKKAMGLVTTTAIGNDAMGLVTTASGNMGRLKCDDNKAMGMPKCDEDYDNDDEDVVEDEDFVEEILKD